MMSVFYINVPVDPKGGFLSAKYVFPQLDTFLIPEHPSKGSKTWTDKNGSEVIVTFDGESEYENSYEMMIRIDTSRNYTYFLESIIAFVQSRGLQIVARKDIVFPPDFLNEDVIKANLNDVCYVENPLSYLTKEA